MYHHLSLTSGIFWLVVSPPLKNMSSSIGMMRFPTKIWESIIQSCSRKTTKQYGYHDLSLSFYALICAFHHCESHPKKKQLKDRPGSTHIGHRKLKAACLINTVEIQKFHSNISIYTYLISLTLISHILSKRSKPKRYDLFGISMADIAL